MHAYQSLRITTIEKYQGTSTHIDEKTRPTMMHPRASFILACSSAGVIVDRMHEAET